MQIQNEIRKGAIIVFATKYSGVAVGLLVNSILARLLSPAEFGVVAVAMVCITFFNILGDIGLGAAIVQNQSLNEKELSDIFKISVVISLVLTVAFALVSYGIAAFYKNQVYIKVGQLLSITVFLSALSVVPKNLLVKEQSFKTLGIIDVGTGFITGLIAVFLAWKNFSFYSIVWRSIISGALILILYIFFSGLQIKPGFSFKPIRKIAKYSSYQFAFNFINYFSRNLDNILIGKFIGNAALGIYNQSYQLMMYPIANLTSVITLVLHPILAKHQDNIPLIFQEYLKIVNLLALLGIPISIFVFFSAEEIIMVLLGNNWIAVIPVLKILSLSIWTQMILSSSGSIFQAAGRTDMLFVSGALSATLMITSILVGVIFYKALEVTAALLVITFQINFVQAFFILIKLILRESLWKIAKIILNQLPCAITLILMYILLTYIKSNAHVSILFTVALFIKLLILVLVTSFFNFSIFRKLIRGNVNEILN